MIKHERAAEAVAAGWHVTVTDLKQWAYCPRVVFYAYCMPRLRPLTFKMEAGLAEHEEEKARERRRTGQVYGVADAERWENVVLVSDRLGVRGRVDLVLRRGEEAWPVEYKLSRALAEADHFKVQLAMYAILLEEAWGVRCRSGFLYSLSQRRAQEVAITAKLRKQALAIAAEIRAAVAGEQTPGPTPRPARCVNCEFRRFCNDVL